MPATASAPEAWSAAPSTATVARAPEALLGRCRTCLASGGEADLALRVVATLAEPIGNGEGGGGSGSTQAASSRAATALRSGDGLLGRVEAARRSRISSVASASRARKREEAAAARRVARAAAAAAAEATEDPFPREAPRLRPAAGAPPPSATRRAKPPLAGRAVGAGTRSVAVRGFGGAVAAAESRRVTTVVWPAGVVVASLWLLAAKVTAPRTAASWRTVRAASVTSAATSCCQRKGLAASLAAASTRRFARQSVADTACLSDLHASA